MYPEDGLLHIVDAIPESEICQPMQYYVRGDPAVQERRARLSAGSKVSNHHYAYYDVDFTFLGITIVPYSGESALSSSTGRAVSSPSSLAAA